MVNFVRRFILNFFNLSASGSAAQAGASSQSFNQGGGFPGHGGGISGSAANAAASSQSFNQVCEFCWDDQKASKRDTIVNRPEKCKSEQTFCD